MSRQTSVRYTGKTGCIKLWGCPANGRTRILSLSQLLLKDFVVSKVRASWHENAILLLFECVEKVYKDETVSV